MNSDPRPIIHRWSRQTTHRDPVGEDRRRLRRLVFCDHEVPLAVQVYLRNTSGKVGKFANNMRKLQKALSQVEGWNAESLFKNRRYRRSLPGLDKQNVIYTNYRNLVLGVAWRGMDTGSNLQKLKVPEISSGPRQEKRDNLKPQPRWRG